MNNRKPNCKIKSELIKLGWSQRDLAERTKIREEYISMAIHGKYVFDEMQKIKVASALGCDEGDIFGNEN